MNRQQINSVLGIGLLGLAVVQLTFMARGWTRAQVETLLTLLLLATAIGSQRIRFLTLNEKSLLSWLPLGALVSLLTTLRLGLPAGIVAAFLGNLVSNLRIDPEQRWSSLGRSVWEVVPSGVILLLLRETHRGSFTGWFQPHPLRPVDLFSVLGASLAYGLVTFAWKRTDNSGALVHLFSYIMVGFLSAVLLLVCPYDFQLRIALLLMPSAYLTYLNYSTSTEHVRRSQKHEVALQVSQSQLSDLYLATIKSLALAIDAKDQYTHQHILRVQQYSVAVGEHMGLSGNEMEGLKTGALLHDIGKLGVPEYVLLKPGRLTPEEFDKIKKHPEIGAAILDPVEFPWPVLPVVKYHHEKWNGTGYPEGLAGEQIPLTARILAVADVYDALTSTRSYRNAWPHARALKLIEEEKGAHFDPVVADAFLAVIDRVVQEMAREGKGPLAARALVPLAASKADQAARDIHRASSELWALYEVAQTLSASMGVDETLEILARKLEALLPGAACLVLLKSENNPQRLDVRAAVGTNRELFLDAYTAGPRSLTLRVVQTRETFLGEYDHDDLMIRGSSIVPWTPLHSALIIPIVHQGEALGAISLYHQQAAAFTPHDRNLLEQIAERVALALYNGLLYERTRGNAFTDPLTELYNLRFLTQLIEKRCQESATDTPFALLCVDLDCFKPVNDNFGHQRGDQVLRELAEVLRGCVGSKDIVARYGGDEFLLILEGADAVRAEAAAERLMEAISAYDPDLYHPRLGALRIGVSLGFSCFPSDGRDCTSLIAAADRRMQQNKTDRKLGSMAAKPKTKPARRASAA